MIPPPASRAGREAPLQLNRPWHPYSLGARDRRVRPVPRFVSFHAGPLVLPASLSELLFWLAASVCLVAQVAVVRAALAGRTPGTSPSPLAQLRELFWVLLPAALLALLLGWTWSELPSRLPRERVRSQQATAALSPDPSSAWGAAR